MLLMQTEKVTENAVKTDSDGKKSRQATVSLKIYYLGMREKRKIILKVLKKEIVIKH